jgi:osmotically-inducible protein OsmY
MGLRSSSHINEEYAVTKTDMQLKQDIEEELRWDPKLNAAQIGVSVDQGTVTLTGSVDTYAAKWAAEDATKRVAGVRTVAQDLTVKILAEHKRTDPEIAAAVESALKWNVFVPKAVTARVSGGSVTLEGPVTWNFQREAAETAIRHLSGVVTVVNFITIKPEVSAGQVKEKVQAALLRQATSDASSVHVDTSGGKVTLSGHVASWRSMDDAENAAWAAPGVNEVVDKMTISP